MVFQPGTAMVAFHIIIYTYLGVLYHHQYYDHLSLEYILVSIVEEKLHSFNTICYYENNPSLQSVPR